MKILADLQLHSKYSRAVSQAMIVPEIAVWAKRKGIDLIATGDWTHPMWLREIKANLEELGNGLLALKDNKTKWEVGNEKWDVEVGSGSSGNQEHKNMSPLFLLATEISSIYSQGGKGRRIHTLIWAPSIAVVEKINAELTRRGANLLSDGRPIIGLSSIEVAELVLSVDPSCLIIPAHCLLPNTPIHTNPGITEISRIKEGDRVLTHKGRYRKVQKIYSRPYDGSIYTIKPWYFSLGLTTTKEHPYWAVKTVKKCRSTGDICRPVGKHVNVCTAKHYQTYKPAWIAASKLEVGDVLLFPRLVDENPPGVLAVSDFLPSDGKFIVSKSWLTMNASRVTRIKNRIPVGKSFCRLIGYYLAEGYVDKKGGISFAFALKEQKYIEDVKQLMYEVFGLQHFREYKRKRTNGKELVYYSKIIATFLRRFCYESTVSFRASTKKLHSLFLTLPKILQAELVRGWWRGDRGYTSSRTLMNQLKVIFLRLDIIPSIYIDSQVNHQNRGKHHLGDRTITARNDNFILSRLAFLKDNYGLLKEEEFLTVATKLDKRHGWMDEHYAYLPIRAIELDKYSGLVYNLEVEEDNSYTSEFATVHNCWTPWFSLYGSESGFDSIDECFGSYAKHIYAIETGLSSDPAMNWRIKELDTRAILSFSDAHSGPKLGREATVFNLKELSYQAIKEAIIGKWEVGNGKWDVEVGSENFRSKKSKNQSVSLQNPASHFSHHTSNSIACTIEFFPEEGKYHYTGHRVCGVKYTPAETRCMGTTCPVCGRKLTVGVMHRVDELAGRSEEEVGVYREGLWVRSRLFPKRPPYAMMVPLQEILAEVFEVAVGTQKVQAEYTKLSEAFGGEFSVLLKTPKEEIEKLAGERIAEAVHKVRIGDIKVDPGYDGVFGKVKIWKDEIQKKTEDEKKQLSLF